MHSLSIRLSGCSHVIGQNNKEMEACYEKLDRRIHLPELHSNNSGIFIHEVCSLSSSSAIVSRQDLLKQSRQNPYPQCVFALEGWRKKKGNGCVCVVLWPVPFAMLGSKDFYSGVKISTKFCKGQEVECGRKRMRLEWRSLLLERVLRMRWIFLAAPWVDSEVLLEWIHNLYNI